MKLAKFSYVLPKDRIAQHPPKIRGQAKLLVLHKNDGRIEDRQYTDVIDYLQAGDVLVLNDTKVVKARLMALGGEGKWHELLLLEIHGQATDVHHHKVLYKGTLVAGQGLGVGKVDLKVEGIYGDGTALVSSKYDLDKLAEAQGSVPLPPYMKREATSEDTKRYQTEFAKAAGSVAAPTASLNMTKELISKIKARGVIVCYLTLHVGLGTFLPIRTDDISNHHMHSEWFSMPASTAKEIQKAKSEGRRVVAVGTTVARTLEYCAPVILIRRGGEESPDPSIRRGGLRMTTESFSGEADIFIYPGYEFKVVDVLLTNFHAPKSTVLMLTAAFAHSTGLPAGRQGSGSLTGWPNLQKAYQHALAANYRFLSYGDSMLILK